MRKLSRFLRIVSHERPDWKPSSTSFSNSAPVVGRAARPIPRRDSACTRHRRCRPRRSGRALVVVLSHGVRPGRRRWRGSVRARSGSTVTTAPSAVVSVWPLSAASAARSRRTSARPRAPSTEPIVPIAAVPADQDLGAAVSGRGAGDRDDAFAHDGLVLHPRHDLLPDEAALGEGDAGVAVVSSPRAGTCRRADSRVRPRQCRRRCGGGGSRRRSRLRTKRRPRRAAR